jgi:hypothetical protein
VASPHSATSILRLMISHFPVEVNQDCIYIPNRLLAGSGNELHDLREGAFIFRGPETMLIGL